MNDFMAFLGFVCIALVGLFLFLVALLTPPHFIEKSGCEDYAKILGFEYNHTFTRGCVVKTPEGWIKSGNYIITKEEK